MKETNETITLKKVLAEEGEDAFEDPCSSCAMRHDRCYTACGPDSPDANPYFVFK